MARTPTTTGSSRGTEVERVRAQQPEGSERTRARPLYAPRVDIVETEDARDLGFITQYYAGYLLFHWVPAIRVGATRDEREAWASEDFFTPPRGAT